MLNVGDSIGQLCKKTDSEGKEHWILLEDQIKKIEITKRHSRYVTKSKFYPLDTEDVDTNTREMEDAIGQGYILTNECFGLNEKTRPFAERWLQWANQNMDKAVGILESLEADEPEKE